MSSFYPLLIASFSLILSHYLIAAVPLQETAALHGYGLDNTAAEISWGPCPKRFAASVTCATFQVPLDWDNPRESENFTLGMVRIKARKPASRIGYLFLNPGGPGVQATRVVNEIAEKPDMFEPEFLDRFDIIGLDPRGVGLSTPIRCDINQWNRRVSLFPNTEEEFKSLLTKNKLVSESCRRKSGSILDFVDTVSAAKDHEAVRRSLRDGKATFLGLSYGTQLFSQYAQMFPTNIRALVLDGSLQHSQSEYSNLLIESSAYESTLRRFFQWCDASSKDCVLSGKDVEQIMLEILAKANIMPIPAPGCDDKLCRTDVTAEEMLFAIQGFLTGTGMWPRLAMALEEAKAGNTTLFSRLGQLASGDAYIDSSLFGGAAVQCQDWHHSDSALYALQQKQIMAKTMNPLTKGVSQTYQIQASCIGWTARLTNPEKPVAYRGNQTILIVNSFVDPSTSYAWALGLQNELRNAVLLSRNGSGHTSWFLGGETTKLENAYLVNLTLPEPGLIVDT